MDIMVKILSMLSLPNVMSIIEKDREMNDAFRQYVASGHYVQDITGELDIILLPDLEKALPQFNPRERYLRSYLLVYELHEHGLIDTLPVQVETMVREVKDITITMTDIDRHPDIADYDPDNWVLNDPYLVPRLGLFMYTSPELQNDRDVISDTLIYETAQRTYGDDDGDEVEFTNDAIDSVLDDYDTMLHVISKNPSAWFTVSDRLKNNEQFREDAVKANLVVGRYIYPPAWDSSPFIQEEIIFPDRDDRDGWLKLVSNNDIAMHAVPYKYHNDREIVLAVVKRLPYALCSLHVHEFGDDEEMATVALAGTHDVFRLLSQRLRNMFKYQWMYLKHFLK